PAYRVELAVEEYEDRRITELFRRIEVSNVTDEPLLTPSGHPIGIRMRYSVRFPEERYYSPAPFLTSSDERLQARAMRNVRAEIPPRPEKMRPDPSRAGTYAQYKSNVTYSFVIDLVPAFVIQSLDKTRSCILFSVPADKAAIVADERRIPFAVHIDGTDYGG